MLLTFLTAFEQMFRIVFLLAVGYAFNKLHIVPRTAEPVLSKFVAMLFIPSLMLYSNMVECRLDSLSTYGTWTLIGGGLSIASHWDRLKDRFSRKEEYDLY